MSVDPASVDPLTRQILGAAIEVHRHLGPGLLESTYQVCLARELTLRELKFAVQRAVPVIYKGTTLGETLRIDLIVENMVVVEVKSTVALERVHQAQVLTYLKLSGCQVGLLINFNVPRLMDGVRRLFRP